MEIASVAFGPKDSVRYLKIQFMENGQEPGKVIGRSKIVLEEGGIEMHEQLKLVVNKYNLIEETQNGFWTNFNQYRKEEPNEFNQNFHDYSIEKLDIWIHSIAYKIKNWPECDYEFIAIRMEIEYAGSMVGKYEACYSMCGEYEDDYFVIY